MLISIINININYCLSEKSDLETAKLLCFAFLAYFAAPFDLLFGKRDYLMAFPLQFPTFFSKSLILSLINAVAVASRTRFKSFSFVFIIYLFFIYLKDFCSYDGLSCFVLLLSILIFYKLNVKCLII